MKMQFSDVPAPDWLLYLWLGSRYWLCWLVLCGIAVAEKLLPV